MQRDEISLDWYMPRPEERRLKHFTYSRLKISHGYCPTCFIMMMEEEGMTQEEIIKILEGKKHELETAKS